MLSTDLASCGCDHVPNLYSALTRSALISSHTRPRPMKRSQASSPLQGSSSHSHKKLKVSPPANQGVVQDDAEDGEEWTTVEKRKTKKVKKIESSLEVCPWSDRYMLKC